MENLRKSTAKVIYKEVFDELDVISQELASKKSALKEVSGLINFIAEGYPELLTIINESVIDSTVELSSKVLIISGNNIYIDKTLFNFAREKENQFALGIYDVNNFSITDNYFNSPLPEELIQERDKYKKMYLDLRDKYEPFIEDEEI